MYCSVASDFTSCHVAHPRCLHEYRLCFAIVAAGFTLKGVKNDWMKTLSSEEGCRLTRRMAVSSSQAEFDVKIWASTVAKSMHA